MVLVGQVVMEQVAAAEEPLHTVLHREQGQPLVVMVETVWSEVAVELLVETFRVQGQLKAVLVVLECMLEGLPLP
jgi:hypothetical protein